MSHLLGPLEDGEDNRGFSVQSARPGAAPGAHGWLIQQEEANGWQPESQGKPGLSICPSAQ